MEKINTSVNKEKTIVRKYGNTQYEINVFLKKSGKTLKNKMTDIIKGEVLTNERVK